MQTQNDQVKAGIGWQEFGDISLVRAVQNLRAVPIEWCIAESLAECSERGMLFCAAEVEIFPAGKRVFMRNNSGVDADVVCISVAADQSDDLYRLFGRSSVGGVSSGVDSVAVLQYGYIDGNAVFARRYVAGVQEIKVIRTVFSGGVDYVAGQFAVDDAGVKKITTAGDWDNRLTLSYAQL